MFPLLERYHSLRLDVDLAEVAPGAMVVRETPCRLGREAGYGYVRVGWWQRLVDGRAVMSVLPGAGARVAAVLRAVPAEASWPADAVIEEIRAVLDAALLELGWPLVDRCFTDVGLACNGALLTPHAHGDCRRLTDTTILPAEGLRLPTHCFPDGLAYGVVADARVAAVAYAHRTGVMEAQVAEIGIETAPAYRRRGYAQTALSAMVGHITRTGGESCYRVRPDNAASLATARSVGYVPYGSSVIWGTAG